MSETHFSRADWRPGKRGKRRLRKNNYGGCKIAPPAFLAAAKESAILPGRTNRRICTAMKRDGTPCGMLALRDVNVCGAHGGWSVWAKRGVLKKSGKGQAIRAERAAVAAGRSQSAPASLARMPIYQAADQRVRVKMVEAYGTATWRLLMQTLEGAIKHCD